MPLFIYFAAMLPNVPHTPAPDKVYLFPIGMLGFWLSAAWLSLRASQGEHVPGLEIAPLLPFRPDFILPGGVLFVKGTIMLGAGAVNQAVKAAARARQALEPEGYALVIIPELVQVPLGHGTQTVVHLTVMDMHGGWD